MNLYLSSSSKQVENKPSAFRKLFFFFMLVPALLATGCLGLLGSGAEPTPAPVLGTVSELPLAGNALLTCNQTCADQAQCGTAENLGAVVLLNSFEPSLDAHSLIVGTNFPVEIREHRDVEVRRNSVEQSQFMRFYKVSVRDANSDRGDAWVAGWCIQQ
ncbi:MAG: hypothetical protein AB8G95_01895 [Anaerolineae bacterium]